MYAGMTKDRKLLGPLVHMDLQVKGNTAAVLGIRLIRV